MEGLRDKNVLVTGGAGFIGANLVSGLLSAGSNVIVLDNFETGKRENLSEFLSSDRFKLIEGDITDPVVCQEAVQGIDMVTHQAALGSVPRSIAYPHRTHDVNGTGFLNMLHAAKEAGIKRFVYASSSSVYGDSLVSPKTVGSEGNLLSPYAVTKKLNEQYAAVYNRLHGMQTIGLRYFNVFGPKQDPHGVYAAAIPKFIDAMLNGGKITIHGDGSQTRDFTYVDNAVKANLLSLSTDNNNAFGNVFNVACGVYYSLNQVVDVIRNELSQMGRLSDDLILEYGPERPGDIKDSLADISRTTELLGYQEPVYFKDGMKKYLQSNFAQETQK
ncbi:MAG: SDR family NAD(P)-dependent oxidoreductase [Bacteroidota bacterium]|jgi:UDP-N-acetylglucosamine 4-epimerase